MIVEQPRAQLVGEVDVGAQQRQRGAVDRRERRPQLVRDGGDEVGAHQLERALVGEVAEGVDRALVEADAGDREPELAPVELERERLGAAVARARSPRGSAPTRSLQPVQHLGRAAGRRRRGRRAR